MARTSGTIRRPLRLGGTGRGLIALGLLAGGIALAVPQAEAAGPTTFSNATAIPIADATSDGGDPAVITPGTGSPYPSDITVSGMTGTITDVDVVLDGLSHGIANDLDLLVVSPTGQSLVVLSDPGTTPTVNSITSVNGTYTFSDGGATVPDSGAIAPDTYSPKNNTTEGPDAFPAPAPAPGGATTLATFNGADPNGTWKLYVVDDADGDVGTVAGGWSVRITTADVEPAGAFQFSSASTSVAEGAGPATIVVNRVGGAAGATSVRVQTANGSATAGLDYTAVDQIVNFIAGQTTANVSLPITDDVGGEPTETVGLSLSLPTGGATLGSPSAATLQIIDDDAPANDGDITIPAQGPATPYPSCIAIGNPGGTVTDVNVTLTGLAHAFQPDLDVLLVGPGGGSVVLASDVGGTTAGAPVDLVLDDEAGSTLPTGSALASGTFEPTDTASSPVDAWPSPAPAGPHGTALSAFDGAEAGGVWCLYVFDDAGGDAGSISGWSLAITTLDPAVDAGGPYTVAEGGSVSLTATPTDLTAPTYAWDLDDDGTYDDATGANPSRTWAQLQALGLGNGPSTHTIGVQATSGADVVTDTATLSVTNTAPSATLGNGGSRSEGSAGTVSFTGQADPSTADVTGGFRYAYDFDNDGTYEIGGNGSYAQGDASASVTVPSSFLAEGPGTRTIGARIIDKDGGFTGHTTTIAITNVAPTATFTGNSVTLGQDGTVTFSNQADPSAVDVAAGFTYDYDLDGNGSYESTGSPSATATVKASRFTTTGDYTVNGRIIDADGGATIYATTITVATSVPTATFTNDGPVAEGGTATVTFSGQSDPAPGATFTYDYDFNDDGTYDAVDRLEATATVPAALTADGPTTVTVTGRIKNQFGGSRTYDTTITVTNTAPTFTAGNDGPVDEGGSATVSASAQSDPSAADLAAGLTYGYDFGDDGSYEVIDSATATEPVPAALLDDGPGALVVRIRATDRDGASSEQTTTVTVDDVDPTATFTGDQVVIGQDATVTFSDQADPSGADTTAGFTYDYDLDDDGTYEVADSPDPTATVPAAALPAVGTYDVAGRILDKDGGATTYRTTIEVVASQPSATFGNDGPVDEGSTATVTFTDQADPGPGATFAYSYDFDGDGTFDIVDSTEATAVVPGELTADGPATVTVTGRITNQFGGSTDLVTEVEVRNVAPTATLAGPPTAVAGEPYELQVGSSDPSAADEGAPFGYEVDWDGDGVVDDRGTLGADRRIDQPFSHVFAPGSYTITVTLIDVDGGRSEPATLDVVVSAAPTPTPTPTPTTVPGGATPAAPGGTGGSGLVRTGQDTTTPVAVALVLFLTGTVLVAGSRRRRRTA